MADSETAPGSMAGVALPLISPLLEKECDEKILGLVLIPNFSPTLECGFNHPYLFENVRPAPFGVTVIVGGMPMLEHYEEGIGD